VDYADFAALVRRFLFDQKPELNHTLLTPEANLWELGYVDSLSLVELIVFVEGVVGREIDFAGDTRTFRSTESIYRAHVRDAAPFVQPAAPASDGAATKSAAASPRS
jgi:acyl carrier protein